MQIVKFARCFICTHLWSAKSDHKNEIHVVARHFPQNDFIFEDDNAPVQRIRSLLRYQTENSNRSRGMLWPVTSPGANIIEICWLLFKTQLSKIRMNNAAEIKPEIRVMYFFSPPSYSWWFPKESILLFIWPAAVWYGNDFLFF